jgi:tRNA A58 N-methylase Trm61
MDRLAPFDPTPQEVVERMLVLAGIQKGDVVYDLGAGDGRVVITAAKNYGVRAVGYESDPGLAKLARENVRKQGVEESVEIREQDFMSADLSRATVVTLYLSQDGNLALRSKLLRELRPEARVVSYTFDMGDWQPKIVESYRDAGGDRHMLYLWQMSKPLAFSDGGR